MLIDRIKSDKKDKLNGSLRELMFPSALIKFWVHKFASVT